MYPNLLHSLFTLIIITIATLFEVPTSSGQVIGTIYEAPTSSGQDVQRYDTCGQLSKCGDIDNISYPFSGASRPDYCGYPGFGLTCVSDTLLFKYQSISYRVLRIDYPAQIITVARNDLWDNICPQKFFNTTYDFTLFKYDSFGHQNLSLYYDCGQGTPTSNQFSCKLNGVTSNGYFVRTDAVPVDLETGLCSVNVIVPLNQASAQTLAASPSESALISALRSGFGLQWTENNTSCDRCVGSGGRCGSNTTSPSPVFSCYCADRPYPSICNETVGNPVPILFTVLVLVVLVGAVLLFATLYRYRRNLIFRKTGKTNDKDIEIFIRNHGPLTPKRYRYSEIKKMTNSFTDKLGQGGYGSVYKGNLHDGRLVAVKLLSEAKGGREDFMNEVASISKTSHVNVVTLLGFCFQGNKRALLYEFMPNGSLDRFICNNDSSDTSCHLDWKTLYQIVVGIARGLEYLHRGCNTRIVHFDIKPHNILLDEDFCPKISDFGLAKLCKRKDSVVSMLGARGTAGYIAPEVFLKNFGGASHKSDVYSYGMMILEMTGARKNDNVGVTYTTETYFPDRIYKQVELRENLGVYGVTTEEEEIVRKMILVSLWCIQTNPSDRPSITKVVEMLEGGLQTLQVPPKPFLSSPMRPLQDSSPSFSQSSENIVVPTNANEILSSSTLHEKLQQEN